VTQQRHDPSSAASALDRRALTRRRSSCCSIPASSIAIEADALSDADPLEDLPTL
jgi:hypothetical protein